MIYLSPLLKAASRVKRLTQISDDIYNAVERHPWLNLPLVPPHLLVRWLIYREMSKLQRLGYPVTPRR